MSTTPLFKPESLHPLAGVDPALPPDDLAILAEIVGNAKVVGLGEPTHGQKEINQLRDRITRYLVEHQGFRVVAMEDSAINCRAVNDFIVHGRGTAPGSLSQQNFWTWKTREVLALIEWLREWNVAHPDDTVRFIGIDIQDFATPVSELFGVLVRIDLEVAASYNSTLTAIGKITLWGDDPFDSDVYAGYLATLIEIRQILQTNKKLSLDDLDLGLDCVRALKQALLLKEAITESPTELTAVRWNRRDQVMASRVLTPVLDGTKMVLWAQNGHVQSERPAGLPPGAVTIGQQLRQELEREYAVISGMFGSGGYRGYDESTGALGTLDVGDPPEATLDHELWSQSDSAALLVDLGAPGSILFEPQSTRWAGALLVPGEDMLASVRPAIGSNAIAFVREATPSEPI